MARRSSRESRVKKLTTPDPHPAEIRRLIDRYGKERVYRTSIDVLGYPPTLELGGTEIVNLKLALAKSKGA
jgi:hypothetical protein